MNPEFIKQAVLVILGFNAAVSGLRYALEMIKDKTETKLDNDAFEKVSKIAGFTAVAVDWLSANTAHPLGGSAISPTTGEQTDETEITK